MMRVLHSRQLLVRDDEQLPAIFVFFAIKKRDGRFLSNNL